MQTMRIAPGLLLLGLSVAPRALAQTVVKAGGEFEVNTYTEGVQSHAAVAMDADGDFVVVWQSLGDGSFDVFGRRYNSAGVPQAIEFQVNTFTLNNQELPAAAMAANGAFVVAWVSVVQDDGYGPGVFARRFDSTGGAQGGELQVTHTTAPETRPSVAIDGDGDFVVAWEIPEISAQRFDSSGAPQGGEIHVNAYVTNTQDHPDVAMDGNGGFVVVWESSGQDLDAWGIFGRRFDSAGAAQANEFQVNAYTRLSQRYPRVAADDAGDFVVVWQSERYFVGYPDIFARRFGPSGTPEGPPSLANVSAALVGASAIQGNPDVAMGAHGDFVVSWDSLGGQDGDLTGVFARRFNFAGTSQSPELQVNSYTTNSQSSSAVAMSDGGRFVVVWGGLDGSQGGQLAQRFNTLAMFDVDGDGRFDALTDGLLTLRYAFGFTGATLVTGAVGQNCTRCDPASITSYFDSLF